MSAPQPISTFLPAGAPLADEVGCPRCQAEPAKHCRTRSGKLLPRREAHEERWRARARAYGKPRRYVLLRDDPQFHLFAGDVLVCEPYALDPRLKLTVLRRERDGFDPSCNVYHTEVRPIRGPEGDATT
jgi:hypothetical protein